MNIQQHERIVRIKKLSRGLYLALTGAEYLLWLVWPLALAWLWLGTKGTITLLEHSMDAASLGFLQRCLIAAVISLLLLLLIKVARHMRQLMLHFAEGDIFNRQAIDHARKALHHALGIYGIYLLSSLTMALYIFITHQSFDFSINGNFILGLIIFGSMYILLWALEIGCDLNEESELTI